MIIEGKVTEIFFMTNHFCKFFDTLMLKYALKSNKKRIYHRESTISKAKVMLRYFIHQLIALFI